VPFFAWPLIEWLVVLDIGVGRVGWCCIVVSLLQCNFCLIRRGIGLIVVDLGIRGTKRTCNNMIRNIHDLSSRV